MRRQQDMPTTIRAMRKALKEANIPVVHTPAERVYVGQSIPQHVESRKELLLFGEIHRALDFTEEEKRTLPDGVNIYDLDKHAVDIKFSMDQLDLLVAHFEFLEKGKKLPNQIAIATAWEKYEIALDGDEEEDEEEDLLTLNGLPAISTQTGVGA